MPRPLSDDILTGDILHAWQVKEYEEHDRPTSWYIFMGSIGLLLVIYGLFSGNFIFSLIIILAGIIFFIQSSQQPQDVPIFISELGIGIGNRFYKYSELEDFYIIYRPDEIKMLFIETKTSLRPLLRIALNDNNPLEIRDTLDNYLVENFEKEVEPLSEALSRNFKLH